MNIVSAKDIVKDYKGLKAVNGVSFEIKKGECFGFLGPNGAGKTTVLGIIYCFMLPTSGDVSVFGINVTEDPSRIKSMIGVMPQDDNLDPDLSVIENLIVYARYFGILKNKSAGLAMDLLDFVELREKADSKVINLSGGMKRRLILARALINNPELMILDEPTTGLDPHSRRAVWERLEQLKKKNTTLVLTTHYMEEAENLCDRVAIMDKGKIVTIDSPSNLKSMHNATLEGVYLKLTGRTLEG